MEQWRPVVGHERHYEVSNLGRVRSLPRKVQHGRGGGLRTLQGRILKRYAVKKGHGYIAWHVSLSNEGRVKKHRVAHLVLAAFDRPRLAGEIARHIDGNPDNDRSENLKWGTPKQNGEDMVRHGTSPRGERNGNAKLSRGAVDRIREDAALGHSHERLAGVYGVSRRTISRIVRREVYK